MTVVPEAPAATLTGRVLAGGQYELGDQIAIGATAAVYRARASDHPRQVAVKVLSARFAADAGYRAWFLDQAAELASLHHPNLVGMLDSGDENGLVYAVMQLAQGGSLSSRLAGDAGLMDLMAVGRVVAGTGAALAYLHRHGVLHLDIKPGNILFGAADWPLLADFGIARRETWQSVPGSLGGTPGFMSPEQAAGGPVDARSDVYALAATARHLLAGRPLSPELERVLEQGLAADARERFPSAGAFAEAFAQEAERMSGITPRTGQTASGPRGAAAVLALAPRSGGLLNALAPELVRQAGAGLALRLDAEASAGWGGRLKQTLWTLGGVWLLLAACCLSQAAAYLLLSGQYGRLAALALVALAAVALLGYLSLWQLPIAPFLWPAAGLVLDRRLFGTRLPPTEAKLSHRAAFLGAAGIALANTLWVLTALLVLAPALSWLWPAGIPVIALGCAVGLGGVIAAGVLRARSLR